MEPGSVRQVTHQCKDCTRQGPQGEQEESGYTEHSFHSHVEGILDERNSLEKEFDQETDELIRDMNWNPPRFVGNESGYIWDSISFIPRLLHDGTNISEERINWQHQYERQSLMAGFHSHPLNAQRMASALIEFYGDPLSSLFKEVTMKWWGEDEHQSHLDDDEDEQEQQRDPEDDEQEQQSDLENDERQQSDLEDDGQESQSKDSVLFAIRTAQKLYTLAKIFGWL
jgi:hypothetical protein